jgi:hypothetical protein
MAGIVDQIAESLRTPMIAQGPLNFCCEAHESVYSAYVEMKRYSLLPKVTYRPDKVFCFCPI